MDNIIGFSLDDPNPNKDYNNQLENVKHKLEDDINKIILHTQNEYNVVVFIYQNIEKYNTSPISVKFVIDIKNTNL